MKFKFSFLGKKDNRVFLGIIFLLIGVLQLTAAKTSQKKALLRFPDIHGNTIVFVYGEDIWKVEANGGIATRLTVHDGAEVFPKFSPDGKLIAFSGDYDGNTDVYVMDVYGGNITRVTYHPGLDQVVGWHPGKNKIIFSSNRHSYSRFSRLYLISTDGSGLEELILHEAVQGSFSPDGSKIAYNKVAREHRTWKRYQGGTAQEVYVYDFKTNKEKNMTNFKGTDRIPMWIGNKIYFSSDRDRVLNIYSCDTNSGKIQQLTRHKEYDVRRPSMGGNQIVYELGGDIWLLDVQSRKTIQVPIQVRADAPETRTYLKEVKQSITDFDISPKGNKALIVARGEIFSVPREGGITRNITQDCGSRDKDVAWSPDGKKFAYLSDKNGEYQIYIAGAKGQKEKKAFTAFKDGYRHTLRWSPDGTKIAFADQTLSCYYLDIHTKKIVEVDKAYYENVDVSQDLKPIYDFSWSPDSRFIAYSKMNKELVYNIYIYSLDTGKRHCVSYGIYNDFYPVFSTDGKYLFFISNRRFIPTYCDFEWELVYKDVAGIYCLSLAKNTPSLFPYKTGDVAGPKPLSASKKQQKAGNKVKNQVIIDFDGISERVEAFPLPRGNYRYLAANQGSLFFMNLDKGDFNRFEFRVPSSMDLYSFSFKSQKASLVMKGINKYKLTADGSHIGYKRGPTVGIIKSSAKKSGGKSLNLSDLKMFLNPRKEWKQIFNEAWRLERDFYYEANMHGVDWNLMKSKYGKLLAAACCRQDVRYIIGELIGELNTSHTYVYGGDRQRRAQRVNVGMLGVDWQVEPKTNLYQFKKIYRVSDWSRDMVPPLAKPGIKINEGDYLLKVNGREVKGNKNIYSYFQNLAGQLVTLVVNNKPTLSGAREYVVKPSRGEFSIRYHGWVEHNRRLVDKVSKGQIGYLHLPDTYQGSSTEFPKLFYSQLRKKGLIIDGRFNGGGLDPDIFLRRLQKPLHAYWTRRYSHDQTIPDMITRAHMVCLTNRQAGSGGDMLPMEFQMRKMGPVIGTRTWGGLVGVSMFISLIDGGGLSAPDYRIYDKNGKWIVENEGVQPDIVIDLHPQEMARGYDAQLMKGVEVLMKKIKSDPRSWPKHDQFKVDK